jgi:DUF1680 family protein
VALKRGPLVYCFEEADNSGGRLDGFVLPLEGRLHTTKKDDLFGGIVTIAAEGVVTRTDWSEGLYRPEASGGAATRFVAIPYCLWGNREAGKMLVWVPET